jgi:class 3 adenylate cyclase
MRNSSKRSKTKAIQTRSDILARFLTKSIVNKFSNKMTMQENLSLVLTPRPTKAALMQADIRGYSRISATLEPKEMVQMLQNYYKNVVDSAQIVAQVKLIGDCIFLFIEESSAGPDISPVDMCVELASILVNETNLQNKIRGERNEEPMYFGIAIHYGDVVVGNLSSESCIDYTVIGPNVNMVARLEEITKMAPLAERIGKNGTILSEAAFAALKMHSILKVSKLNLPSINVSVRSFHSVTDVYGVTADQILEIKPSSLSKSS